MSTTAIPIMYIPSISIWNAKQALTELLRQVTSYNPQAIP
jgi:hypothetical protein